MRPTSNDYLLDGAGRHLPSTIVCPVVVGGGKRFFPEGVRLDFELLEARRFDSGVVVLRYAVRG